MTLAGRIEIEVPNLGMPMNSTLGNIPIGVRADDPVYIDCTAMTDGFVVPPDAQYPFHGGALDELNRHRFEDGIWNYEIPYDPGGGLIGQFEEGPLNFIFGEGEYDLWQLISIYVIQPTD
jgi:hypothetical protein